MRWLLIALACLAPLAPALGADYEDLGPEHWAKQAWGEHRASFDSEADCVPIARYGCWYAPATIHRADAPALLVFLRGWRDPDERSNVPPAERVKSSQQAFAQFGLGELARAKNMALIVTGAPPLAVPEKLRAGLERSLGLRFSRVILASHSAGYQGLDATLSGDLTGVRRIVMLDNFYMEGTLLRAVNTRVGAGAACNGFFTYDSRDSIQRHQDAFKRVCRLEDHDDTGHFDTINKCLSLYVDGLPCP